MTDYINSKLAYIKEKIAGITHLHGQIGDISIDSLPKYRKSCSLPKGEIPEGPEHATNADPEQLAYDDPLDKFLMVVNVVCRALLNPLGHKCTHKLALIDSGQ